MEKIKEIIKNIFAFFSPSFKKYSVSPKQKYYHKRILTEEEGNELISYLIQNRKNFMVGRIGTSELSVIKHYDFYRKNRKNKKKYPLKTKNAIWNNAGFFPYPEDDVILDKFAEIFLESVSKCDAISVWYNPYEHIICKNYCPDAELIPLRSREPYYFENPWSRHLAHKKILVINPFVKSISSQYYTNREKLFDNKNILPEFDLKVLKSVQSIAGEKVEFDNWFKALDYLKNEIIKIDFDIAIIGAGCYGMPLTGFIKDLGKSAIYIGGATQILFGVKGKGWEKHAVISKFFNEYWINPFEEERPKGFKKVEDGCYW